MGGGSPPPFGVPLASGLWSYWVCHVVYVMLCFAVLCAFIFPDLSVLLVLGRLVDPPPQFLGGVVTLFIHFIFFASGGDSASHFGFLA